MGLRTLQGGSPQLSYSNSVILYSTVYILRNRWRKGRNWFASVVNERVGIVYLNVFC